MTVKIIRSANLVVLRTWLIGGQYNTSGDCSEGFHDFYARYLNGDPHPKNLQETKDLIKHLIAEYGNEPSNGVNGSYVWYDDNYKFKMPSAGKLDELAQDVWKIINEANEEYFKRNTGITILEGNYTSVAEAKEFADFCEAKGYNVDYRENTSGAVEGSEWEQEASRKLWLEFCGSLNG